MSKENINIRMGTQIDKQYILSIRPQAEALFPDKDNGYFIVAEGRTLLGCAMIFQRKIPAPVSETEAFINLIEVFDEAQYGKGIASFMIEEIVELERKKGTYQLRAYCDINNISSHALWRKHHFGISPVKMPDNTIVGSFATLVL